MRMLNKNQSISKIDAPCTILNYDVSKMCLKQNYHRREQSRLPREKEDCVRKVNGITNSDRVSFSIFNRDSTFDAHEFSEIISAY